MTASVPRSASQREIDGGAASRKTLALAVTIVALAIAGACVGVLASRQVRADIAKEEAGGFIAAHKETANRPVHATTAKQLVVQHEGVQHVEETGHKGEAHHRKVLHDSEGGHRQRSHDKQHHPHLSECRGGAEAACSCILACKVFGGSAEPCGGEGHAVKKRTVDDLIQKSVADHRDMCEGMRCIKDCAARLGCMDDKVRRDCLVVEKNYELHRNLREPGCHLNCEG
uniref:Uncharacterized protein n=1 Tax=Alexandrium catenella TaxID=2925 RepID=A0A7S1PW44_ALECA|mmetsp:Transcript_113838/g.302556  ORF Transcript_113838/g.302556 Transcript_113838/m.302556 type:complete len:228 (+) Transcript_113838:97-780(+)